MDTNRIIASLIKDGDSRKILLNKNFEFASPDYTFSEIYKYEEEIIKKADITHEEFEILLSLIFENISVISEENYKIYFWEAGSLDIDNIWSDDSHFVNTNRLKIFRMKNLINSDNLEI